MMFEKIKKYAVAFPIVVIFFVFLFGIAILDVFWPKRAHSEMENRDLDQLPAVTVKDLLSNKWMSDYGDYVKDQFVLRDEWISLKSRSEYLLAKTENNGVWYGKDNYLFTKFLDVNESRLEKNITLLADFAQRNAGKVNVMIVPSASNILASKLPWQAPVPDENAWLDKIASTLDGKATVYDMRSEYAQYIDDYIYYRTDHHWTTYGAYLAYTAFAQDKGLPLFDTETNTAVDVTGFLGTNFSKTRNWNVVADTLTYYPLDNVLTMRSEDAATIENNGAMYNTEKLDVRDKYAMFLYGNNGYSTLQGNGNGSILVIKDSYANCFIPFLTADYANIGIIDLRNYNGSMDELIAQEGYDEVLVLYNFQSFMEDKTVAGLRK